MLTIAVIQLVAGFSEARDFLWNVFGRVMPHHTITQEIHFVSEFGIQVIHYFCFPKTCLSVFMVSLIAHILVEFSLQAQ